jgi:hypothetical protein
MSAIVDDAIANLRISTHESVGVAATELHERHLLDREHKVVCTGGFKWQARIFKAALDFDGGIRHGFKHRLKHAAFGRLPDFEETALLRSWRRAGIVCHRWALVSRFYRYLLVVDRRLISSDGRSGDRIDDRRFTGIFFACRLDARRRLRPGVGTLGVRRDWMDVGWAALLRPGVGVVG